MDFDLRTFIWENLEAAGVIGGYVSISIISIAAITFLTSKNVQSRPHRIPRWAQAITGAMLGVIPGCGGTIVASSMYKNQKLSFGGLLAAFITTLGEGSFVLLGASDEASVASNIQAFMVVNIVGFIVGVLVGTSVDLLGLKGGTSTTTTVKVNDLPTAQKGPALAQLFVNKIGFSLILVIALFLAPGSVMALWGGSISVIENLTVWTCVVFTLISMAYYITQRFVLKEACHTGNHSNLKEALSEAVADTTMVISYVFLGLIIANFLIDVVVGPEAFNTWMSASSSLVVLLSALIGVTPGCGGMIAVAVAYITIPAFPIAALLAGSIATSGDGIFPLLAENKKDALRITGYSFVLALLVGFVALALGF